LRRKRGWCFKHQSLFVSNFVEEEGQGRWMLKNGTDFAEK